MKAWRTCWPAAVDSESRVGVCISILVPRGCFVSLSRGFFDSLPRGSTRPVR